MTPAPAPVTSTPPARPFLELPPEIRNYIYGYCIPVNGDTRDYEGLFLSCKQTKSELEGEAVKVMAEMLSQNPTKWRYGAQSRINKPAKFSERNKVIIELPRSTFYRAMPRDRCRISPHFTTSHLEPSIASLLQLHLSELIVTVYKDKTAPARGYYSDLSPCHFVDDIQVLLYGGASSHQAAFSNEYIRDSLKQAMPMRTQRLVVRWLLDEFSDDINVSRGRHFSHCHVMRGFAEKDVVMSWDCDGQSFVRFDLKTTGDD